MKKTRLIITLLSFLLVVSFMPKEMFAFGEDSITDVKVEQESENNKSTDSTDTTNEDQKNEEDIKLIEANQKDADEIVEESNTDSKKDAGTAGESKIVDKSSPNVQESMLAGDEEDQKEQKKELNNTRLNSKSIVKSGTCGDNVSWTLDDEGVVRISGTGDMYDYELDSPFRNTSGIKYIIIEDGVSSIGRNCFMTCKSLIRADIPNSVTSIGESSFYRDKSLTSITIPDGVTSIGGSAFDGCSSLTSITIPESVASIGEGAFSGCSKLTSITIPESVTSIENRTFCLCSGLTSITIPESVTSIGIDSFGGCSNLASITIPESVTSIGRSAFTNCKKLTSIIIPDGVTSIGERTFGECSGLTSITIPESVTSIGQNAFEGCSSLTSITIPNGVTSIGIGAFDGCSSLTSITIPNGVTSIKNSAFKGCSSLTSITIPESVTSIENYAFKGCSSLTSITSPSGVTSIGNGAFDGCSSLTSITLPDSLTNIGSYAFRDTGLTSISIPDGVTNIETSTFYSCDYLTSVTIPYSVISIGNRAFYSCNLAKITVPFSVTSIGDEAFDSSVVLVVNEGSYALSYAKKKGLRYEITTEHEHMIEWDISLATCTEPGTKTSYCKICNEVFSSESVPAKGHSWSSEYTLDIEPTVSHDGVKSIHCTECGAVQEGSEIILDKINFEKIRIEDIPDQAYTGRKIEPEVNVYLEETPLTLGQDYSIAYSNNSKIGQAQVQITFADKYDNNVLTVHFNIVDDGSVDPSTIGYQLKVNAKNPFIGRYLEGETVTISANSTESQKFNRWAIKNGDISLSDSQLRENPLTFTMPASDVEIKAGYIGETLEDEIAAENSRYRKIRVRASQLQSTIDLYNETITRILEKYGYNSDEYNTALEEFQPKINQAQAELDSIDLEAEAIIHDNNIKDICRRHFVKDPSVAEIDYINLNEDEYDYTGAPIYPTVTVIDSVGKKLGNESYEVVYPSDCTSPGKHVITLNLKGDYTGTKKKTFTIVKHQYSEWIVTKEPSCTETGEKEKQCIDCGKIVKETIPITHTWNSKYTIDKAATYAAAGSKSIHCSVCNAIKEGSKVTVPKLKVKAVSLSKVSPIKKGFTAKWKKGSSITGYELQYALNSKFTKSKKTIKITKPGTLSKKVTKLKAKKKYYVRIRTYKIVKGKKYNSSWSKYKTVTTK